MKKFWKNYRTIIKILKKFENIMDIFTEIIINYLKFTQILGQFKKLLNLLNKFKKILQNKLWEKLIKFCWKFVKAIEEQILLKFINLAEN